MEDGVDDGRGEAGRHGSERDEARVGSAWTGAEPFTPSSAAQVGVVVFGDVVRSRRAPEASSAWLRHLVAVLDEVYGEERLAPFGFTQGDEIQGLLAPGADPIRGVLRGWLDEQSRPMRWMIAAGRVIPGEGPATQRTGDSFLVARSGLERLGQRREGLQAMTGDPRSDRLLEALAPLLADLVGALTTRQREVARLALVAGCRQSEIAVRLGVSPATVSVIVGRARVRSIGRLAGALSQLISEGIAAALADGAGGPGSQVMDQLIGPRDAGRQPDGPGRR